MNTTISLYGRECELRPLSLEERLALFRDHADPDTGTDIWTGAATVPTMAGEASQAVFTLKLDGRVFLHRGDSRRLVRRRAVLDAVLEQVRKEVQS